MKSVCGSGRIEPQEGKISPSHASALGANGPGSLRSDSPSPWPKRPPSAWVKSADVIWPAPVGRVVRERVDPDVDAVLDVADGAGEEPGSGEEQDEPDEDVGEAVRRDVDEREEGAEEHQRRAEVADEDEHHHRGAPDDEERAEVLERRDRQAHHAPGGDREKLASLVQVAREEDDDADLSQLGRLEGEGAEVDRQEGAVDRWSRCRASAAPASSAIEPSAIR